MANVNEYYPGETLPFKGLLTDKDDAAILFASLTSMSIVAVDRMGTRKKYTKASGDITEGDTINEWRLYISATASADFKAGPLTLCIEFFFTDADVGAYTEYDEYKALTLRRRNDSD